MSSKVVSAITALLLAVNACGCTPLLVGAAAGAGAGATAVAKERRETSVPTKVGTVAVNVLYVPAKVIFAAGGAVLGTIAYVASLGDGHAAMRIWKPSVGGTYVLTPAMVEGRERIRFLGS